MKKAIKMRAIVAAMLVCAFCASVFGLTVAAISSAGAESEEWYVCFSAQSYAVRNANKMTLTEDGAYILENVSLRSSEDFYVTDNAGKRYYGGDNEPLSVEETAQYAYDILFSPDTVYGEEGSEWAATGCHITYRFYIPAAYCATIGGEEVALTYNPYHTDYDVYYLSSVLLEEGGTVSYGEESHTIAATGYYRILFTPDKTENGNLYRFNADGDYGSGDGYEYNLYIEDAPRYYAVFKEESNVTAGEGDAEIDGKSAYLLERYEKNTTAAEYRTSEFFTSERDSTVKYAVYELSNNGYRPVDDDNDEDTAFSKLTATDAGWYTLSMIDGGSAYISSLKWSDRAFGGFYAVGAFNGYGFDEYGGVDVDEAYRFKLVEEEDEDYNEDYEQYILYFTVTERDLKAGDVEFYITDGADKYKNGTEYIALNTAGRYKILFSEEHIYSRGRYFRYTLLNEDKDRTELYIGTAAEFTAFAENCAKSADYSVNLSVYLTADIDFSGVKFTSVKNFSGTLYGGYHTLKNIVLEADETAAVVETLTRTGVMERLYVENLSLSGGNYVGFVAENYGTIRGVTVSGSITAKNYAGGIAAVNGKSINDNDAATTDSDESTTAALIVDCKCTATVLGQSYVGGIAGCNSGNLENTEFSGMVGGKKSSSSSSVYALGGVAGYSDGKITNCANTGRVEGGDDSLYVGGVCGLCESELYFCFNEGSVSATRYAGGICGYYGVIEQNDQDLSDFFGGMDYRTFLENYLGYAGGEGETEPDTAVHMLVYCVNTGDVKSVSYAGGVVGACPAAALQLHHSASTGNVSVTAGNYAGGIIGYGQNVSVLGCMSAGNISAKGLNAGNYAGGVAGYANDIRYSMSAATVKGSNYVGGIAGVASGTVIGCYANVLLLADSDSAAVGGIAGVASAFNASLNSFGDAVKGNYYVGDTGGVGGVDYAENYNYAAASVASEKLAGSGSLSPFLSEDFVSEYWQGGRDQATYPTLWYFENVSDCAEFGDEETWNELFAKYKENFSVLTQENARITYTVVFMEWNKDNGDLFDDEGNLQYDHFDVIYTERVFAGETVASPALTYAELSDGRYIYEGDEARYFVSFKSSVTANGNLVVYAEYVEVITSLSTDDGFVFAEGDFYAGTTVELVRVGDYYALKFYLDGREIDAGDVRIKVYVGADTDSFIRIFDGEREKIAETTPSGDYLAFDYSGGQYFLICQQSATSLPFWAWLLIGMGAAVIVFIAGMLCFILVRKKRADKGTARR